MKAVSTGSDAKRETKRKTEKLEAHCMAGVVTAQG
jgi:hypothetical protein